MSYYSVCEAIKLEADTANFKDGETVKTRVTLMDSDKKVLGVENDKDTVKKNHVKYVFKVKDLANKLNISKDKIKYIKGWIDADGDGIVEYEEEFEIEMVLITKEILNAICPNAGDNKELVDALNKYCPQYEINTCLRVAHFLAQTAHESGCFKKSVEDDHYRESQAINCLKYKTYRNSPSGKTITLSPIKNKKGQVVDYWCKQPEYFNCKYANSNDNGNFESGDGYKYRGRGLMQITGKSTYKAYKDDHQKRNSDDIKDFVNNPDLVTSDMKYIVSSACSYWFNKKLGTKNLNELADKGSTDEAILKISGTINGYTERNKAQYDALSADKQKDYTKANDNLYIKTPNGYDDRIAKFHKLKKFMDI